MSSICCCPVPWSTGDRTPLRALSTLSSLSIRFSNSSTSLNLRTYSMGSSFSASTPTRRLKPDCDPRRSHRQTAAAAFMRRPCPRYRTVNASNAGLSMLAPMHLSPPHPCVVYATRHMGSHCHVCLGRWLLWATSACQWAQLAATHIRLESGWHVQAFGPTQAAASGPGGWMRAGVHGASVGLRGAGRACGRLPWGGDVMAAAVGLGPRKSRTVGAQDGGWDGEWVEGEHGWLPRAWINCWWYSIGFENYGKMTVQDKTKRADTFSKTATMHMWAFN
ncbi:hypothetical protein BCR44DRAFT_1191378 [Catenaria anguillulae PL171]|uniref:Uncharacterized protein n=1 Tax=Catenaria anguillulae PL171 TaxID=765915 RepID=A0A1Y2HIX0_9FUNG|nr:hypothetical protein BCR44DRAFT_1191378 [Catenaria anguillulae PL171]